MGPMTTTTVLAAAQAPMHPALRWTPLLSDDTRQHRRTQAGNTACGLYGPLVLADPTDGHCPDCFPEP